MSENGKKPKVENAKVTDFQPDPNNPNLGSERGSYMINDSVQKFGAARSIVVDKNGIVLAGNKTQQALSDIGVEDAVVVDSDGQQLVVVRRNDLDLLKDPERAREYTIADNRTSEISMNWSPEELQRITEDLDIDLGKWFYDWELDKLAGAGEDLDYDEVWEGMPEFKQDAIPVYHSLKIHFLTEEDMNAFAKLVGQTITKTVHYMYYPKQEKEDLKKYRAVDES